MAINAGYMGLLKVGNSQIRFTDCSVAAKQEYTAPDLVMGDYNHDSYYAGAITIEGSCSGPIDEKFGSTIFNNAWDRNSCGNLTPKSLDIQYYCKTENNANMSITSNGTTTGVMFNSLSISATAGDVANFSFDVVGAGVPTFGAGSQSLTETRRLVTWDALNVTVSPQTGVTMDTSLISAFEFTITNNVTPAYTLGSGNLFPSGLITGIRTISGSVTVYNVSGSGWPTAWSSYSTSTGSFTFTIPGTGGFTKTVPVVYHRIQPSGQVGPVTSTVAFTGVGYIQ